MHQNGETVDSKFKREVLIPDNVIAKVKWVLLDHLLLLRSLLVLLSLLVP